MTLVELVSQYGEDEVTRWAEMGKLMDEDETYISSAPLRQLFKHWGEGWVERFVRYGMVCDRRFGSPELYLNMKVEPFYYEKWWNDLVRRLFIAGQDINWSDLYYGITGYDYDEEKEV